MNKKAQGAIGIGIIMIVFITVLVGVILFQVVAQQAEGATDTADIVNETITGDITNLTVNYIPYRAISSVVISNGTAAEGTLVAAANYTIGNNAINPDTGELSVSITPLATADFDSSDTNVAWTISGTVEPQTYVSGAAASVTSLIAIFFALAIAVVALEPTLRSGVLNAMGK